MVENKSLIACPTPFYNGRFVLESLIGRGGMAEVYRAYDQGLGRWRAIKIMLPDYVRKRKLRARFETEAKAMALLDHKNIVRVYDVGIFDGAPFIVMELCPGGSLEAWLMDQGPFSPRLAVDCIQQICAGVQEAHNNGVIHRDIKSQNILVGADGRCKITDFGIAQTELTNFTNTGSAMGTLGFMAPEQRSDAKKVDHRSDVYSIGATLYNLLTGKVPTHLFAAEQDDEILAGIDAEMLAIIKKATEYKREARYQSVAELCEVITALAPQTAGGLEGLRGDYTPPPVPRVQRKNQPVEAPKVVAVPPEPVAPVGDSFADPASERDYVISVPPQHVRKTDSTSDDPLAHLPPIGAHQAPPPPGGVPRPAERQDPSTGLPARSRNTNEATVPPRRREFSGYVESPSMHASSGHAVERRTSNQAPNTSSTEEESSLIADILDTLAGPGLFLAIPLFLALLGGVGYYAWSSSRLTSAQDSFTSATTTFISSVDRSDDVFDALVTLGGDAGLIESHLRDFEASENAEQQADTAARLLRVARSEFAKLPPPPATDTYAQREYRKVQGSLERMDGYLDDFNQADRTLRSRSSGLFGPL